LPLGWALTYSIIDVERYFPNFQWNPNNQPLYLHVKSDVDCYGDPAIQYWRGVPQVVEADYPESISPDRKMIEVHVTDPENDADVAGAQVILYVPGEDMPDFDDEDYADYDDMMSWITTTDEDGMARYVIDDGALEPGMMYLTAMGRDIRPCFGEIEIEQPPSAIEIGSYDLEQIEGNDDGDVNPGESFSLSIIARNVGNRDLVRDVTGVVSTSSPWVEIEDHEMITFGDIDHEEEAQGNQEIVIHISLVCPDGESRPITRPVLTVDFAGGDDQWRSAIELNPSAPNFEVRSVVGGNIMSTDRHNLNVEIKNIGSMNASELTAELVTFGTEISVFGDEGRYPAIRTNRYSRLVGDPFAVSGNILAIPGSSTEMLLILRTEAGFIDTTIFDLQVDEPREDAPQGPDGYGYICFDDTDTDWQLAPEYDWFEISLDDRNREEDGTRCHFDGNSPFDVGESETVDLPFTNQFYGYEYDQITIATNGFIAMGDQERVTNFQNWPMDRAMGGGMGMIAPLWDNLRFQDDSDVYYYHDEEQGRFIVEWYELRHRTGGNSDLTFQVILYDPEVWHTVTGDPNILIQYKNVRNVAGRSERSTDNPYASVG
ncbi:MAG: hypothetical protein P9M15_05555, partial [Candidatus Electryoneaceae bacterium]|nr:hypothetical protein [Candidatus Electryoneaceae bacterium]